MKPIYKKIRNPSEVFIIAEAGSNWKCGTKKQDLAQARKLIKTASVCGADAIKFQTYDSSVYVENAGMSNYLSKKGITKSVNEIFDEFSMSYKMLPLLKKICQEYSIEFMSTPFSIKDIHAIDKFVNIHKLASYEINHIPMLEALAKTKKPVIISTGASTLEEINFAIKTMKKFDNNQLCLLQCTSKYPAKINSLNLSVISNFKTKYKIPVGLSDHSTDPLIAPITAVGLGATIIEKHFTLDKSLEGPDHYFALDPIELKTMVTALRNCVISIGNPVKKIHDDEKELRIFAHRAIQTTKKIEIGEKFILGKNIEILRPGNRKRGIDPRFLKKIINKKSRKQIKSGDGVTLNDI
ncbi:N-acylneuraminate-9-phosphate synthase [Candidatus Nitrosopelagicus brevis]|uniref:N-acylneuraminate-9-phosphate synthase n=1 Tax=Candidatus Nitrosopelagicus brevis TaxID=1410606 RepID=A0A0A7UZN8_9ARCH|nr:N-acetylneuraminate synthase family protein [Candidatus Nitrosopelagicus brevis]AJA92237.1 NeuB family protein [Candidatus Nitrosopelagicus brevis]MAR69736.1 N-acylneuraminate-9-phosphate synthase [Nitrospina sp.]PTL87446.1 N-acylneuraminate-9-phosphate synthase [Candidatus Nitrosopelagicus brevis]|tara:strand:- start:3971 stop:5029 length:1059 start_codon:yes stop_codon:yes gene_type:complete